MEQPAASSSPSTSAHRAELPRHSLLARTIVVVGIAAYAAIAFIPYISVSHVFQVSEGREGVVINRIVETGDYVLPLRHGTVVPSKPPLFHWTAIWLSRWFELSDESQLRLPSVVAAVGMTLATALLSYRWLGTIGAWLTASILLSTYGMGRLALDGRVDMLFTFLSVCVILVWSDLLCAINADTAPPLLSRSRALTMAVFGGLAILAKGPLGVALPVLVIVLSIPVERHYSLLRQLFRWEALIALLIPLPWYVLAYHHGHGAFVGRQLIFENVQRFVGGEGISEKDALFYVRNFWDHGAPWTIVFVLCLFSTLRRGFLREVPTSDETSASCSAAAASCSGTSCSGTSCSGTSFSGSSAARTLLRTTLVWIGSMLILFSAAAGKRRAYLLPTLPAIAIFCSAFWTLYLPSIDLAAFRLRLARWSPRLQKTTYVAVGAWFVLMTLSLLSLHLRGIFPQSAVRTLEGLHAVLREHWELLIATTITWAAVAIFFSARAARRFARDGGAHGFLDFALALFAFLQLILGPISNGLQAIKGFTHSYHLFAERLRDTLPADCELKFIKEPKEESFDGFFFYYKRNIPLVDPASAPTEPGCYLARRRWWDPQLEDFKSRATVLLEGGRTVDEEGEPVVLFRLTEPSGPATSSVGIVPTPAGPAPTPQVYKDNHDTIGTRNLERVDVADGGA